jgi:hypothetical protein
MELKIVCGCGQKYAFDVEPVNGRMPVKVACPACGADGTEAANNILGQYFPDRPPPVVRVVDRPAAAPVFPPPTIAAVTPAVSASPLPFAPRPIAPLKSPAPAPKLSWYQYLWIGLPLVLIALGGCLGGACGGAACAVNHAVFQKTSNPVLKYVWTGMISAFAFIVWLVIAAMVLGVLHGLRPR